MPPELEDMEQEIAEKKEKEGKEWLEKVQKKEEGKEPFIPWDDNCELPTPEQEAVEKRVEIIEKERLKGGEEEEQTDSARGKE